jgi:hypothetical protein
VRIRTADPFITSSRTRHVYRLQIGTFTLRNPGIGSNVVPINSAVCTACFVVDRGRTSGGVNADRKGEHLRPRTVRQPGSRRSTRMTHRVSSMSSRRRTSRTRWAKCSPNGVCDSRAVRSAGSHPAMATCSAPTSMARRTPGIQPTSCCGLTRRLRSGSGRRQRIRRSPEASASPLGSDRSSTRTRRKHPRSPPRCLPAVVGDFPDHGRVLVLSTSSCLWRKL